MEAVRGLGSLAPERSLLGVPVAGRFGAARWEGVGGVGIIMERGVSGLDDCSGGGGGGGRGVSEDTCLGDHAGAARYGSVRGGGGLFIELSVRLKASARSSRLCIASR